MESRRETKELHILGLLKLNQMSESSVEELVHFAMAEGIRLTRSRLGFIQFMEEPAEFFLFTISSTGGVEPVSPKTTSEFRVAIAGVISEAVARKAPFLLEAIIKLLR